MDEVQLVRAHCEREGIGEVPVCDMNDGLLTLRGIDGNLYREVDGNIWMPFGGADDVAYVGTSKHGGHMTLRPLFVKVDGIWRNSTTGCVSDFASWNKVI